MNNGIQGCGGVAAFFDLDGTLVALPSLERRFFRTLRYRRAIPVRNYFLWFAEALRLAPSGVGTILQANKMYLRGVQSFDERGKGDDAVSPWHKSGHQAEGQASAPSSRRARRNPRLPVPVFLAEGIERVVWHGKQGHAIVLVSGTLEPLAQAAARAVEVELAARGIFLAIRVCATRLEEVGGRWTGRILGEALFGEAKERAVRRIATEMKLDLTQCYAYGDSVNDRCLLEAVGRPTVVNPSNDLGRIAREHAWPVMRWEKEGIETQRRGERRENQERRTKAIPKPRTEEVHRVEGARMSSENIG